MFIVLNPGNGSKDFTILTPWQDLFIQFQSQLSCEHTAPLAAIKALEANLSYKFHHCPMCQVPT